MKSAVDYLKRIPVVGSRLRYLSHDIRGNHIFNVSYWIERLLEYNSGTVLQIGSNDGKNGDLISEWLKRKKRWSAVFVEPVPYLFERLKENYAGESRFRFENSLVNDGSNTVFYWVSEDA